MGLVAVGVLTLNLAGQRQASFDQGVAESRAFQSGNVAQGTALLAQRLQDETKPPVTAQDLREIFPGVLIEDEGGKLSLPSTSYALPSVMQAYGLDQVTEHVEALAGVWQLSMVRAPHLLYPVQPPGPAASNVMLRFETPEDLGGYLELPWKKMKEVIRWFTPCDTVGINVNTADERCVEGVLAWHQACAKTWTDRPAEGAQGGTTVHLWPLPGQEQVVSAFPSAEVPQGLLNLVLPSEVLAVDSSVPYNPLWHLVRLAVTDTPFAVPWLPPPPPYPYKKAQFSGATYELFPPYTLKDYGVRPNAWMKHQPAGNAQAVMGGRPYAVSDLTQPLGLLWYTPEAWFMPVTPASTGEFEFVNNTQATPKGINVGLSAAAFTGWVSLQGPGPYRAASDWYTFEARGQKSGSDVVTRITLRIFPNEMPTVLMASAEEE